MKRLIASLGASLIFASGSLAAGQSSPSLALQTIPSYPNSARGLETMFNDMLALAKRGDQQDLARYFQSLVLPHHEAWFASEFGDNNCGVQQLAANDCLGPRLALAYASIARALPVTAAKTLSILTDEDMTNFEAVNYSQPCAAPQHIVPARQLANDLSTTPILSPVLSGLLHHNEPVYVLWSYSPKKETNMAFFVYSEGAFRYIGMPHPASIEEFARKAQIAQAPDLTSEIIAAKPVLANEEILQRTVVLHVIIGPDGKAREVSYARGPENFKDAAIQYAERRNFGPQSFSGHAIQTDTCINVVFRKQ